MNNNVKKLTRIALLIAVSVVLSRFLSVATPIMKIGFAFLPLAIVGIMYGPFWGALAAGLADFIGAILFPIGPYFPGYTLTASLMGFTYGLFLQNAGAKNIVKILSAAVIVNLGFHLCLNTVWIQMFTGKAYLALLPTRFMSNMLMVPIHTITIKAAYEVLVRNFSFGKQYVI